MKDKENFLYGKQMDTSLYVDIGHEAFDFKAISLMEPYFLLTNSGLLSDSHCTGM